MTLRWLHRALSENRMCHISHKERSRISGLEATTVCFQRDASTHYFVRAPNTTLVHIYTRSARRTVYTLITQAARTRTPALGRKGHLTEISGVQKRGEGRGLCIPLSLYTERTMFRKAKIFSLGIMHIYTFAYIVYILCERVTFSRQSSTYNQPFNKWHIQIKSQQLYLVARLCCFSHFICAFSNNKFSWSLAIHCYQLWGIRDIKQNRHATDVENRRKKPGPVKTGTAT